MILNGFSSKDVISDACDMLNKYQHNNVGYVILQAQSIIRISYAPVSKDTIHAYKNAKDLTWELDEAASEISAGKFNELELTFT